MIPDIVVERVPLARLVPWPLNPRKNHAVDGIARSIEAFGYLSPIVVQRGTYRILAGHGRLAALKLAGAVDVPVVVADIDDDRASMFTLADNKLTELADWDFAGMADLLLDLEARNLDVTLTGFDGAELERLANWAPSEEGAEAGDLPEGFEVVVACRTELERVELLRRLSGEGFDCR